VGEDCREGEFSSGLLYHAAASGVRLTGDLGSGGASRNCAAAGGESSAVEGLSGGEDVRDRSALFGLIRNSPGRWYGRVCRSRSSDRRSRFLDGGALLPM